MAEETESEASSELARLREENAALRKELATLRGGGETRSGYVSLVCLAMGFYGATLVVAPDEPPPRPRAPAVASASANATAAPAAPAAPASTGQSAAGAPEGGAP